MHDDVHDDDDMYGVDDDDDMTWRKAALGIIIDSDLSISLECTTTN